MDGTTNSNPFIAWLISTLQQSALDVTDPRKIHQSAELWQFLAKQFHDALSPDHFPYTNPDIFKKTMETGGSNLVEGFNKFINDLLNNNGQPIIPLTDMSAFTLGKNIACTPGDVIFQNNLMQLICYHPKTKKVYERPLLIIPPWINKFYILDLRPENSLVRWLVDHGIPVFIISWRNPDSSLRNLTFDDYLTAGPVTAMKIIKKTKKIKKLNLLSYCIAGTLTACFLANQKTKIHSVPTICSATFLTTLLDFSNPGDLGLFINEKQLDTIEKSMHAKGYMDGTIMAGLFGILRARDLLWPAFTRHYLKNEKPPVSDFLYWNADATHIPEKVHRFWLRNMYLENKLITPDALILNDTPIDVRTITVPTFFVAGMRDHIVPWQSCYQSSQLLSGPVKFVLSTSGHVAGVINPPENNRYSYHIATNHYKNPEDFLIHAKSHTGSWWPAWLKWLKKYSGDLQPTENIINTQIKTIEPAPGHYVKVTLAEITEKENKK